MIENLSVAGLPLPDDLITAIARGDWRVPEDWGILRDVFGDEPDLPEFYDLETLERENRSWRNLSPHEEWFGKPEDGVSVGIDPNRSVVIGGLGRDMPIVLDYRESKES